MKLFLIIGSAALLSGCASIASGTTQQIAITSSPAGATCDLSRQGLSIQKLTTPASAFVQKSKYDISVACSKDGFQPTTQVNKSGVEGWVFGNLLFGGIIGLGIDLASGAQNHYDTLMNFNLPVAPAAVPVAADHTAITLPTS